MVLAAEIREKADMEFSCAFLKKDIRKLFQKVSEKPPITEWSFWL